jgi:phosphinothricin acetyltransferase
MKFAPKAYRRAGREPRAKPPRLAFRRKGRVRSHFEEHTEAWIWRASRSAKAMTHQKIELKNIRIRDASRADLAAITEIYNYYVIHTPITFDTEPFTPEQRADWFDDHCDGRRYRLLVAEENSQIVGYAGTGRFRAKPAYDTSVEATIYCASGATGRGIGTKLYDALFEAIASEDINRILGGITLPNEASLVLHRRFGFKEVGIFSENGRKFGRYWDVVWVERSLRT